MKSEKANLTPVEFNALSTCQFVTANCPKKASILDVGVGNGQIALNLTKQGMSVTAVDLDAKAIAHAREAGITALEQDFKTLRREDIEKALPAAIGGKSAKPAKFEGFDVILFSRVLHHLEPLRATVDATLELLKPNGIILVEDFCYERVEKRTCAWLFPLAQMLLQNSPNKEPHFRWLAQRRIAESASIEEFVNESLKLWQQHHEEKHHIAPFEHVKSVLSDHFEFVEEIRVPYLFRYFAEFLPDTASGGEKLSDLAHWEAALAETGAIAPVGVRMIAKRLKK
ncbi:MAG: methyltransferase domain-containing protein [Candidatus Obscuribacter sp.]|nr:methyltransferase domain-containing protein [Candidatus Obscuribacter sp.]